MNTPTKVMLTVGCLILALILSMIAGNAINLIVGRPLGLLANLLVGGLIGHLLYRLWTK